MKSIWSISVVARFSAPTKFILIAIIIIRVGIIILITMTIIRIVIMAILKIRIVLIITMMQVGSPESEEDGEHFSSRPIDFTTGRRMSDDSSEGEEEYFR